MTESGWRFEEAGEIRLLRCAAIDGVPGIAHAFSTRIAFGRAEFDLGSGSGEARQIRVRRAAFLRAAGLGAAQPTILRQVHGARIVDAGEADGTKPAADGAIWVARHAGASPVPAVRTADCVAVLLADRLGRAVAALHAGWRGAAAGIGARAVSRLAREGVAPRDLVVSMGPAILGCCYEVGEEVSHALRSACGAESGFADRSSGRLAVDLHAALRAQWLAAGVLDASIHAAPFCTRCRTDLFFSHRGEGPDTGRLMAVIGPSAGP